MKKELPIRFGLKALKRFDGSLYVVEYFETAKQETIPGRPAVQAVGYVDESVKKSHPGTYEEFHAYVEVHAERLYAKAKAAFPAPIFDLSPEPVQEVTPEKPEIKKSKKKGEKGE